MRKYLLLILGIVILLSGYLLFTKQTNKETSVIKVSFINQWSGFTLEQLPMIKELLEEKFTKVVIDHKNYDLVIDGVFGEEEISNSNSIKLFFTGEAITPNLDKYDLSIGFDHIQDERYIRIPLYYMFYTEKISVDFERPKCTPKSKKHFACYLVSNSGEWDIDRFDGCVARDRIFHKLSLYKKVASGGRHLNNIGETISKERTNDWLSECKFIISYENQKHDGYVTEKPFQSYIAGGVPIYYADKSYNKDVNPESVIFAGDFKDENSLVEYIKKIDNDDDLYCQIYNNRIVTDQSQNYEAVKGQLRKKLFKLLNKSNNE